MSLFLGTFVATCLKWIFKYESNLIYLLCEATQPQINMSKIKFEFFTFCRDFLLMLIRVSMVSPLQTYNQNKSHILYVWSFIELLEPQLQDVNLLQKEMALCLFFSSSTASNVQSSTLNFKSRIYYLKENHNQQKPSSSSFLL